jgi:hypothetical protein
MEMLECYDMYPLFKVDWEYQGFVWLYSVLCRCIVYSKLDIVCLPGILAVADLISQTLPKQKEIL